jgi:hypothetical protein
MAAIATFGPPTFFLTFSCAEYNWPDMQRALDFANRLVRNVTNQQRSTAHMCASDPATVSNQYHRRLKALLNCFILNVKGSAKVLGIVTHYYGRTEYQSRGAPHFHMVSLILARFLYLVICVYVSNDLGWVGQRCTCDGRKEAGWNGLDNCGCSGIRREKYLVCNAQAVG